MTSEQQKEHNALDALGCYEDILVEALKDVDFMDAMALIKKAIPHNNTIRTSLTVLQKIASGDDWFEIKDAPRNKAYIGKIGTGEPFLCEWDSRHECHYCVRQTDITKHKPTHFKYLDGVKHIQMLIERGLNNETT